ncbi:MAG: hypothetical protein JXA77_07270 [Bacteroidales bacterium]|nr:hypothetical protein [Bacteroidales bacterium]MBN2819676.1 hypothetical protein [Bacteroidales bacterium]
MKPNKNLLFLPLLIFALNLKGQIIKSKLDFAGGISAREYLHLGARYQYSDFTQLGFFIGGDLELKAEEKINTYCLDHMIHFGKNSYTTNRSIWYSRQGFTLLVNQIGTNATRRYSYFNLGLGREIAFSNHLGANFDLGIIIRFREYRFENPPLETPLNTQWYSSPLARIQLFFSI